MIIIQRVWKIDFNSNTQMCYALCKEVRRTKKHVYVEFSAGDSWILDGGRENYAPVESILTESGSLPLLSALVEAANDLQKRQLAIDENAAAQKAAAIAQHEETVKALLEK